MTEQPLNHENRFNGTIRLVREEDETALHPILETWIRDGDTHQIIPDEIEGVLNAVRESAQGTNDATYLVAETPEGEVIGMMGFRPPEERMMAYTTTSNPVEFVNAFVAKDHRGGKGVGSKLVSALREQAKDKGHTEVVFNSGPRYKFSGWPIWLRLFGRPIAKAKGYYGEDGDASVWREELK